MTIHPKTLAPCGADETSRSDLIRDGYVPTLSPASRGSSDAITKVDTMPRTYINGLEHDDGAVEIFLATCRRELKSFPRRAIPPSHNNLVPFRNPATNEVLYLTRETAEFIEREGLLVA